MADYFGKDVPKLGFGLMRLPKLADGKTTDIERTKGLVDMFMQAGLTYFDTAYVYGDSEVATKAALVDRYPRGSYTLCTKLNAWLMSHDEASAKQQFYTSLERTGAGYFDYYLLHALQADNYRKYDEYRLWDFVREQKEKGLIRHYGFSFHAGHGLLDRLLSDHPEVEFVQLQINYADWEDPKVESRACYEVARKHGKSIVVMEPVKGGSLASPPPPVRDILSRANPGASPASWAVRFAASLDGILTVLSGMSTEEQVRDNVGYMKDFRPLDGAEREVIRQAQEALAAVEQIKCTSCRYCTPGCPVKMPIPDIFSAMNLHLVYGLTDKARREYAQATGAVRASQCVKCGKCQKACPQHLPIIRHLEESAAALERA